VQAILLIGIPGSGKSTFYRERFFDTHVRVSLDLVRTRERRLLDLCLETQMRFVVDNTNATAAERARHIAPARAARFAVHGYFFRPDPKASFARNQQRAARVPPAGFFGMLKRLERPRYDEGFDRLWEVVLGDAGAFVITDFSES
jgi:predicted kinase